MRPSLWDYVREAFNAKPIGMFLPPNWAMLAGFGLAGYLHDPGWLVLGSGVELGYLLLLGTNARFQRFVAGKLSAGGSREVEQRWQRLVASLAFLTPVIVEFGTWWVPPILLLGLFVQTQCFPGVQLTWRQRRIALAEVNQSEPGN